MDMMLQGKSALITGSTYGIGFAIAEALAAEGVNVTITGRDERKTSESLKDLENRFPDTKPQAVCAPRDITKYSAQSSKPIFS
jgi:NAD(P)-dependent dehydrogenase (short-subunit alcohol dehydrogenase family)